MPFDEAVRRRVEELIDPSPGDVARAKEAAVRILREQDRTAISSLLNVLVDEEGLPRARGRQEKLNVPPDADPKSAIDANDPLLVRVRLRRAMQLAVSELADQGLLQEIEGPEGVYENVPVQRGGHSGSVRVPIDKPVLGPGYQLPRKYRGRDLPSAEPTLFLAGLEGLGLDRRTERCLNEALAAYRRGLFLSCVNLLGAVSEAVWYAAGEQLRHRRKKLREALDLDRTAQVIRNTTEVLAENPSLRTTAHELHSHAAYLRDLRNYGIHPREDESSDLENAFTDSGCALLLLSTRRYLVRLAEATQVASEGDD